MSAPLIITDIDEQRHFWVRCLRSHSLPGGVSVWEGWRYFVLDAWDEAGVGPCHDHPGCKAGALDIAGLKEDSSGQLFCAADFEFIEGSEADALMASMVQAPNELRRTNR
jgi:hypothetical protein